LFNLGILISGRGTNLENIIKFTEKNSNNINITSIICNNPEAYGIQIAKKYSLPLEVIDHKKFQNRENFEKEIDII
jgi:Folate-dependent phosphoribosylglycinamide formyltransferase PurN